MARELIQEFLEREPFEAFRIRASSGVGHDVASPDLVVVLRSQVFVAEPRSDHFAVIPLLHVAGVEAIANGHRSRRKK